MLGNLAGVLAAAAARSSLSAGQSLLGSIFGSRTSGVADADRQRGGVKAGSASSLLSLAVPARARRLGKEVSSKGLSAAALVSFLLSQKDLIAATPQPDSRRSSDWPASPVSVPRPPAPRDAPLPSSRARPRGPTRVADAVVDPAPRAARPGLPLPPARGRARGGEGRLDATASRGRVARISLPGGANVQAAPRVLRLNLAKYLGDPNDAAVPKVFIFEDLTSIPARRT